MKPFDSVEIQTRHQRLQDMMKASGSNLDAMIVLNTADLYYLSGTVQTAHLLETFQRAPPRHGQESSHRTAA